MISSKCVYIYFPFLLPSFNEWNRLHYKEKHKIKKKHSDKVEKILFEIFKGKNFTDKTCKLTFQFFLGESTFIVDNRKKNNSKSRDIINNAPMIKYIEDLLVTNNVLKGDEVEYIESHLILKNIIDRRLANNGTLIKIEEVEKSNNDLIEYFNNDVIKDHLAKDTEIKKISKKNIKIESSEKNNSFRSFNYLDNNEDNIKKEDLF